MTFSTESNFWSSFFVSDRLLSGIIIILLYIIIITIVGYILSPYITKIYLDQNTRLRRYTDPVISFIEKIVGVDRNEKYSIKYYFLSLIIFNAFAGILCLLAILIQADFFPVPGQKAMNLTLAINTVISFLTNTDLQHYSSPSRLPFFLFEFVIIGLMFLSAGTGFAASIAFVRGIVSEDGKLGNFFHDFLVSIFDLILPLSVLATILLIIFGVPDTTYSSITFHPFFGTMTFTIPIGPVASMESIKFIGTNGGGFYGANSAYPFENPNWITNLIEVVSMTVIPTASIFAFGNAIGNKKLGNLLYTVVFSIFIFSALFTFFGEITGIPSYYNLGFMYGGNYIGKETAIGLSQSSIFNSASTITSTGAVNSALIDYTPAGILGVLFPLLLNDPLGGVGTGILNIFSYLIFTVFLVSLMVGKLPEFMGFKISSKEIKYSTYSLITHPLIIIVPLGFTLLFSSILMGSFVNSGSDKITQLLYEYASAAANNGSEMGGFLTNSPFFNLIDAAIMLLGRYLIMFFQLLIAQSLSFRKPKMEYGRNFSVGSFWFGLMLAFVILLFGLLSFFPILATGPLLSWGRSFDLFIGGVFR
ncbi:potassium-transporting ATPase subunit KdpA [Caldiplasma sukawensis]